MIVESLDRLAAFLMIVVLLFVVPTVYQYQRQDEIYYQLILQETQKAADLVCELGYVNEPVLATLRSVLGTSGANYRVTLTHMKKHYEEAEESEELAVYYIGSYNREIYAEIAANGKYSMDLGDFFYISVENTSPTPFEQIKALFGLKARSYTVVTKSGGMIRAEGL